MGRLLTVLFVAGSDYCCSSADPAPPGRLSPSVVRSRNATRWRIVIGDTSSRAGNRGEVGGRDRGCYLPREVFFGRLGFAGAFFTVWASDFGRFLPATSDSFPMGRAPRRTLPS